MPAAALGPEMIGSAMEVLAEVLHAVNIGADGCLGELAAAQLLNRQVMQIVTEGSSFFATQPNSQPSTPPSRQANEFAASFRAARLQVSDKGYAAY